MARFIAVSMLLLTFTNSASAAAIFINNLGGFNAAVAALTFEGTEDFESSTLGPNLIDVIGDPLTSGVPNSYFTTGLTAGLSLTVQSNTLGGNPVNLSPRGGNQLATASAFFSGTPTDQVSNNTPFDSFDMLFGLANTDAASFNPLVFDANATDGSGQFNIRVFDTANTLIFSQNGIAAAAFTNPTTHIGIVAGVLEDIGRINISGTGNITGGGAIEFTGADNISVWTVGPGPGPGPGPGMPEPATLALFGLGLAGLGFSRRRKV